ncbi:hypothetical protein [Nonomuraea sediminis]|uniref:hypothetical protein n=1 Tax=Nonomuraea sediminis TaxID=2835864 RepID=UPI001BDC7B0B|nr:hypothetical protein [Nonomuraea sediminis]
MRTALMAAGAVTGLLAGLLAASPASAEPRTQYYFTGAGVITWENKTAACPGSRQWFETRDAYGELIGYTNSNGGHACVEVTYAVKTLRQMCHFYFYVPRGHATGSIKFKFDQGRYGTSGMTLDEGPREGWHYLMGATNVNSITFTDANDETGTQIGWGMLRENGIKQACPV